MKIDSGWLYVAIGLSIGTATGHYVTEHRQTEPPTCEELRLEEWAHLQCFKNRPQCKIASYQTYERYRQVQRAVKACDRADALQSEIK